jgi:epoxyqueuosine reductase
MNNQDISGKIKETAHALGFDLVGITDAANPGSYPLYKDWIGSGHHAEMGYLSSERALSHRADLQKVLPGCQSVLVLGKKINPSSPTKDKNEYRGKIASYAWNLDYHDTFIPLLLAARAGLGWIGKNSMLINPEIGSFFLISEILLDLPLEPDNSSITDHCGSCTACIDACPTSCILPNRTIDSRRCLSYLSIELKGEIPHELRPTINEWVFGCDICQQVCPWNQRFAEATIDPNFAPRTGVPQPDLIAELKLTPEEFNLKFKGSPIKRTKRRGYLRNIVTSLGNTKSLELIPHLSELLHGKPEPLVRQHTAWALGQIGGTDSLQHLKTALNNEEDLKVIEEIKLAIKEISQVSF